MGDLWGNPLLDALGASVVGYWGGYDGKPRRYYVIRHRDGVVVRAESRVSLEAAARTLAKKLNLSLPEVPHVD